MYENCHHIHQSSRASRITHHIKFYFSWFSIMVFNKICSYLHFNFSFIFALMTMKWNRYFLQGSWSLGRDLYKRGGVGVLKGIFEVSSEKAQYCLFSPQTKNGISSFLFIHSILPMVRINFKILTELPAESKIRISFLRTAWATSVSLCAFCLDYST